MNKDKFKLWSDRIVAGTTCAALAVCMEQRQHIDNSLVHYPSTPFGLQATVTSTSSSYIPSLSGY